MERRHQDSRDQDQLGRVLINPVMGSDLGSAQGVSEHGLIGDGLSGRIERNNLHLLEPLAFLRGRFQFFLRRNLRAAAL
jgi:hypothetical protein